MSQILAFHSSQSDPSPPSCQRGASPVHPSRFQYSQQVHQLYSLAPYGILVSLINGVILVALLWTILPQWSLALWMLGLLIINGAWSLLLHRYRKETQHEATVDRWANWFLVGNYASGCIWGIGGIVLYPSTSIGHEVFLTFVFGGMIAGATALYASHFPAFLAYSLPAATPLTVMFFSRGDSLHISMGVMGFLFVTIMAITARRNHTMLMKSLTLQLENSTLIKNLTHARDQAEALNNSLSQEVAHRARIEEKLRQHQEDLETLIAARTLALQTSESRYRFVAENILDVIWMMELDGRRFSYVSPSVKELRGYSVEEAMAMSLEDTLTPASFKNAQLFMRQELDRQGKDATPQGTPLLLELEHRCKGGNTIWAEVRASLLLDEKGHPLGFAGVTRDITERRKMEKERHQLEAQLLRSQKLEAIGTLAGGIAHDFNNLLTSILGNLSLAKHILSLSPPGETYLSRAEHATMRAKDLTHQLLAFSKGGEPIKHLISLTDLIIETSGFALSGSSVICKRHLDTNLWPIEVDPGQVHQVMHNLIINAIQAMPNGGTLVIKAANLWHHHTQDSSSLPLPPGPYAKVTISDDGIGIPKKQLHKIFEPYFSTKPDGQGLGLASTYAILQKHGGHISVESLVNVGTTFSLYFPACATGAKPLKLETPSLHHGHGTILLMDDEESIRVLAREMLSHCGYQCVPAKDGYEALALYEQAMDKCTPFSAVILDLTVPGSLGGKDTILRLREIDPHVIAFVSSGYSNDPIMANYQAYGFQGVISKPYSLVGFSTTLHQHLNVEPPQPGDTPLLNPEPSEYSDSDTH